MPQKYLITLCAIIGGLAAVLFSPYTSVANDGKEPPKEPPCEDIRLLNQASQNWCRANGWERDTKGSWWVYKKKGKNELKAPDIVADDNDGSERTSDTDKTKLPQVTVSSAPKKELNPLPNVNRVEKTSDEQQIYWTEGKRIRADYIGQAPKGGWR